MTLPRINGLTGTPRQRTAGSDGDSSDNSSDVSDDDGDDDDDDGDDDDDDENDQQHGIGEDGGSLKNKFYSSCTPLPPPTSLSSYPPPPSPRARSIPRRLLCLYMRYYVV